MLSNVLLIHNAKKIVLRAEYHHKTPMPSSSFYVYSKEKKDPDKFPMKHMPTIVVNFTRKKAFRPREK